MDSSIHPITASDATHSGHPRAIFATPSQATSAAMYSGTMIARRTA